MNELVPAGASGQPAPKIDSGLACLCAIAGHFRTLANPAHLKRELALGERFAVPEDLVRAAKLTGMKARIIPNPQGYNEYTCLTFSGGVTSLSINCNLTYAISVALILSAYFKRKN